MHALITGITGLLGRHLAAQLREAGWTVTGLARKPQPGIHACDLSRDELPAELFRQADVVFHTAAAVTDWAPWDYFVANTIEATRRVCATGCRRLVHISTVGVYGRPHPGKPITEDQPYASMGRWDYYTNAKIEAEKIVQGKAVILRPAMIYGPGENGLVQRVATLLKQNKIVLAHQPGMTLPLVHVADVAAAAIRAATAPPAIYNVVNPEPVTPADFYNTIAGLIGAAPVHKRVPYRVAYGVGLVSEIIAHALHSPTPPTVTRYRVSLFGHPRRYATDKIRAELGWSPRVNFATGIRHALAPSP